MCCGSSYFLTIEHIRIVLRTCLTILFCFGPNLLEKTSLESNDTVKQRFQLKDFPK